MPKPRMPSKPKKAAKPNPMKQLGADATKKRAYNVLDELYLPRGKATTEKTDDDNSNKSGERPAKRLKVEDNLFGNNTRQAKQEEQKQKEKQTKKEKKKAENDQLEGTATDQQEGENDQAESSDDEIGIPNPVAPKQINSFGFSSLSVGMTVLARIHAVHDNGLVLTLPGNIRARVSLNELTDITGNSSKDNQDTEMQDSEDDDEEENSQKKHENNSNVDPTKFFKVGTPIRAVVLAIDAGERTVEASVRPSKINKELTMDCILEGMLVTGCIKSEEDRGFIISLGINNCSAFLPKNSDPAKTKSKAKLYTGQIVECCVMGMNYATNVLTVSVEPHLIANTILSHKDTFLTLQQLKAGLLVKCKIDTILSNGLFLKLLDYFSGTVDALHLDTKGMNKLQNLPSAYNKLVRNGITARVLFVDYERKRIGFTLRNDLLQWKSIDPSDLQQKFKIGQIFEKGIVRGFVSRLGLLVDVATPKEETPAPTDKKEKKNKQEKQEEEEQSTTEENSTTTQTQIVLIPTKHLGDKLVSDAEARFPAGSEVKFRVISLDQYNHVPICTLKQSVIEQPFLSNYDVKPGVLVEGTVKSVTSEFALVQLTPTITAKLSAIHYSDILLKNPEKRIQVDKPIQCRVLVSDPAKHKILLTHKKTLVTSELPIVSSMTQAKQDLITHGFVTRVESFGVIVSLYGAVHGLVPAAEIVANFHDQPEKLYKIGQVVKVRIASINYQKKQLVLSFILNVDRNSMDSAEQQRLERFEHIKTGQILECVVREQNSHSKTVMVDIILEPIQAPAQPEVDTSMYGPPVDITGGKAARRAGFVDIIKLGEKNDEAEDDEDEEEEDPSAMAKRIMKQMQGGDNDDDEDLEDDDEEFPQLDVDMNEDEEEEEGQENGAKKSSTKAENKAANKQAVDKLFKQLDRAGRNPTEKKKQIEDTPLSAPKPVQPVVIKGYIPLAHLSDNSDHCESLFNNVYKPGKKIDAALVLEKDTRTHQVMLSLKPLLLKGTKENAIPKSYDDVNKGQLVYGYIKSILHYGCFVGFRDGFAGLAFKTNLSEDATVHSDPAEFYTLGQSVTAYVLEKQEEHKTITVSLKASLTSLSGIDLLDFYLKEERILSDEADEQRSAKIDWSLLPIGGTIDVEVTAVKEYGVIFKIPSVQSKQLNGLALTAHLDKSQQLQAGSQTKARILDVDRRKRVVDLSLKHIDTKSTQAKLAKTHATVMKARSLECQIELIKPHYLVVSIPSQQNAVIFAAPASAYNKHGDLLTEFQIGQSIKITPQHNTQFSDVPLAIIEQKQTTTTTTSTDSEQSTTTEKPILGAKQDNKQQKPKLLPFDGVKSIDEVHEGDLLNGRIAAIHDTSVLVNLGSHVVGRIHITQVLDFEQNVLGKQSTGHPFEKLHVGDLTKVRVLKISDQERSDKYLPLTHQQTTTKKVIELSIRPAVMEIEEGETVPFYPTIENVEVGQSLYGVVHQVTADGLWVLLSPELRARLFILDSSEDFETLEHFQSKFRPNQIVKVRISHVDRERNSVDLSMRNLPDPKDPLSWLKVGRFVLGRVNKKIPNIGLNVQIASHLYGRVFITDLNDEFIENPLDQYEEHQILKCLVLETDSSKSQIELSLRFENGKRSKSEILTIKDLEIDKPIQGYVEKIREDIGVLAVLGRNVRVAIPLFHLSDSDDKLDFAQAKQKFPVGTLVKGKVLSFNVEHTFAKATLRSKIPEPKPKREKPKFVPMSELQAGQKYAGKVKFVREQGVFITIDNSNGFGLAYKTEIMDDTTEPLSLDTLKSLYKEGDRVRVFVVSVNAEKKRLALSLKPSHFVGDESEVTQTTTEKKAKKTEEKKEEDVEMKESEEELEEDEIAEMIEEDEEPEPDEIVIEQPKKKTKKQTQEETTQTEMTTTKKEKAKKQMKEVEQESDISKRLNSSKSLMVATPFAWDEKQTNTGSNKEEEEEVEEEELAEEDLEEESMEKYTTKKAKKAEKKKQEQAIIEKETQQLEKSKPQSAADFDKLLLSSPNSSYVWIQYMAFHISMAEIDKARTIAQKALKTINFREEKEKMNVWIALLNLENLYGSDESLNKVFQESIRYNEPKPMYLRMVDIYERTEKFDKADDLWKIIKKKFAKSSKMWRTYALYVLKQGKVDEFRSILAVALKHVPKDKQVRTIMKFGQMEYKQGSVERGRSIFEELLANHPKRIDLWSIYLDLEMRTKEIAPIRHIFEKATALKLSSKKMKYFFKRWLAWERENGDQQSVDYVTSKVRQYIEVKSQN